MDRWRDEAACNTAVERDPELAAAWIEENGSLEPEARAVCAECPVRLACALSAVHGERNVWGMRGGYFFRGSTLQPREARAFAEEFKFRPVSRSRKRKSHAGTN